jgi:hypothetical protein
MNDAFRQALIDLDVGAAMALWRKAAPHLPQPANSREALATMHMARAAAQTIPPRQRYYSHQWLVGECLPSPLPDHLKWRAERMYPRKVDAVGVAVRSQFPEVRDRITGAMSDAAADCYANDDRDPLIVKPRMMEARARERRGLMLPREVT